MIELRVKELVEATGGDLIKGDYGAVISSISTDTRTLRRGDLFIPLKGERFDGHQFIKKALSRGASGFLTEIWTDGLKSKLKPELKNSNVLIIKVENTLQAYQQIAHYVRGRLSARVIAITGSTGKTSTKDMLVSILKRVVKVSYPPQNFNNEVGVPFTILQSTRDTEAIVLEMAMRGPGQIAELAKIGEPDIGVITNIGISHFEFLGSVEKIVEAKSELLKAMKKDGIAILNYDDAWTERLKSLTKSSIVTFGLSPEADVSASRISLDSQGRPLFEWIARLGEYARESISIKLSVPGYHQLYNALAASAVAACLQIPVFEIKEGLEKAVLSPMRMEIQVLQNGVTVLNDSYNAAPDSVKAALSTLKEMARGSRSIAVLGDMLELGEISDQAHFEVGKSVAEKKIDLLLTVGEKALLIAEGARRNGLKKGDIFSFKAVSEAGQFLQDLIRDGDFVLVKASRAIGLERIIDYLTTSKSKIRNGERNV